MKNRLSDYAWTAIPGLIILALVAAFIVPLFIWFGCRIEVGPGQMAVLVKKAGDDPAPGTIISSPTEKGVQLEVLSEGRYFRNPLLWDWSEFPISDIPQGKLGVVFRKYGRDLPTGEILAKDGTKGVLPDVLGPGKHRLNPFAYEVQIYDAITIQPGEVGVMVSLVGEDPLNGKPKNVNTFTVGDSEKGVIVRTLDPGTYYLNPYCFNVIPVNLQSNRVELSGADAIDFLTNDGFPVKAEGTVEYAITRDNAAVLTHKVGDSDDILRKVILPRVRALARIEGSKGSALTYIVGERRQEFQDKLTEALKAQCGKWGGGSALLAHPQHHPAGRDFCDHTGTGTGHSESHHVRATDHPSPIGSGVGKAKEVGDPEQGKSVGGNRQAQSEN